MKPNAANETKRAGFYGMGGVRVVVNVAKRSLAVFVCYHFPPVDTYDCNSSWRQKSRIVARMATICD